MFAPERIEQLLETDEVTTIGEAAVFHTDHISCPMVTHAVPQYMRLRIAAVPFMRDVLKTHTNNSSRAVKEQLGKFARYICWKYVSMGCSFSARVLINLRRMRLELKSEPEDNFIRIELKCDHFFCGLEILLAMKENVCMPLENVMPMSYGDTDLHLFNVKLHKYSWNVPNVAVDNTDLYMTNNQCLTCITDHLVSAIDPPQGEQLFRLVRKMTTEGKPPTILDAVCVLVRDQKLMSNAGKQEQSLTELGVERKQDST